MKQVEDNKTLKSVYTQYKSIFESVDLGLQNSSSRDLIDDADYQFDIQKRIKDMFLFIVEHMDKRFIDDVIDKRYEGRVQTRDIFTIEHDRNTGVPEKLSLNNILYTPDIQKMEEYYNNTLPTVSVRCKIWNNETGKEEWKKIKVFLSEIVVGLGIYDSNNDWFIKCKWAFQHNYWRGSQEINWEEYTFSKNYYGYFEHINPKLQQKIFNFILSRFEVFKQTHNISESVGININQITQEDITSQADNFLNFDDKEMIDYLENRFSDSDVLNKDNKHWETMAFVATTPKAKNALYELIDSITVTDSILRRNIRDAKSRKAFPIGIVLEKVYNDFEDANGYILEITIKYIGLLGTSGFFTSFDEFNSAAKTNFIKYINLARLMEILSLNRTDSEFMDSDYHKEIADNYKQEWDDVKKHRY